MVCIYASKHLILKLMVSPMDESNNWKYQATSIYYQTVEDLKRKKHLFYFFDPNWDVFNNL